MPYPARQYFGDLAASSYGADDERAPLVLLHGMTLDRRQWHPAVTVLQAIEPGRRVLALDLPGHGESPRWCESFQHDEIVAAIHQAVIEARLRNPVLVGHTRGGRLATAYTAAHPARGVITVDHLLVPADLEAIRSSGVPFTHVAGAEPDPWYRRWLESELPQAAVTVLLGCGHFPHLARPAEFARILATAG